MEGANEGLVIVKVDKDDTEKQVRYTHRQL